MPSVGVLLFLVLCFARSNAGSYDTPSYTRIPVNGSYEERSYPSANWVSTSARALNYDDIERDTFMRLFEYISGANIGGVKMDMTIPVTVKMVSSDCLFCERDFIMSFFIPHTHQHNVPKPTNPLVYIERRLPSVFYVKTFSGYANYNGMIKHANDLMNELEENGVARNELQTNVMWYAGYDSPMKLLFRHNEIWISPARKTIDKVKMME